MSHLFREDRRRSPSRTRGGYGSPVGSPSSSGGVRRLYLTISLIKPTESFGLKCVAENGQIRVDGIEVNSPTDRSGVQRNDIIESLNGHYISSSADMKRSRSGALQLGLLSVGMTVFRKSERSSPGSAFSYLTSPQQTASPVSTGTPEPNPRQSRQLGSLQAAYDNGALTRPEFEAAVARVKGWDPWRNQPITPVTPPQSEKVVQVVPPPAIEQPPATEPDVVVAPDPPSVPTPAVTSAPEEVDKSQPLTEEDRDNYPTIPPETLASLKAEFVRMDANGDGVLTDKELLRGLLAAGLDPESAHNIVMHSMMFADKDGDGKIGYEEFISFYGGVPDDDEQSICDPTPEPPLTDEPSVKLSDVPPELVETLTNAFNDIDHNGDGLITPEELLAAMGDLGDNTELIMNIFNNADTDGDGKINYREFMKSQLGVDIDVPPGPPANPKTLSEFPPEIIDSVRDMFTNFDLNGDGLLTSDEVKTALGGMDDPELVPIIQSIFEDADSDGDGKINWKEFLELQLGGG